MRRHAALLRLAPTLSLVLLACGDGPAAPDATDTVVAEAPADAATTTRREVLQLTAWVGCANGGLGENVHVQGSFLRTIHVWTDGRGRVRARAMTNPQNVRGTGLVTGNVYVGAGTTWTTTTTPENPEPITNNFLLVGRGTAEDLKVHEVLRIRLDADGSPTVVVDRQRLTCR